MDSALRPRDIQARIRSGETAEQVATAAGTSVERIMPFAAPVLAERAHQAQTALRASVRRTSGAGGARTLGASVEQFLSARGLREDAVAWDTWRRADGRWSLTATWTHAGQEHRAELTHDVAGRYVVADNDEARELLGEEQAAPEASGLGHDALALVREPVQPDQPEQPDQPGTPDLEDTGEDTSEDTVEVPRLEEPEPAPQPNEQPDEQPTEPDPEDEQPALDLGETPEPAAPRKRKGRSSVPSWDEIMFGGNPQS